MFGIGSQLKQPDGPIGTISQVLATHRVSVLDLNLLSVRRLVELLAKMIVLRFEIIILMKKAQARCWWSLPIKSDRQFRHKKRRNWQSQTHMHLLLTKFHMYLENIIL